MLYSKLQNGVFFFWFIVSAKAHDATYRSHRHKEIMHLSLNKPNVMLGLLHDGTSLSLVHLFSGWLVFSFRFHSRRLLHLNREHLFIWDTCAVIQLASRMAAVQSRAPGNVHTNHQKGGGGWSVGITVARVLVPDWLLQVFQKLLIV